MPSAFGNTSVLHAYLFFIAVEINFVKYCTNLGSLYESIVGTVLGHVFVECGCGLGIGVVEGVDEDAVLVAMLMTL